MNFDEAMSFISSFTRAGKKVSDLSRIQRLLDKIGNPQNSLKFIHIAGTNGKGSVLEYCSGALIRAGFKTGQFTSPFMKHYCDRIRINGRDIPEQELADICSSLVEYTDKTFSQFEISLAVAFVYFKKEKCDIVCLETGVGGRLDATNVISPPLISIITSVSLDHTQVLGDTVEKIAFQKAGIIKKGSLCILSAGNPPSVEEVVGKAAESSDCPLIIPDIKKIAIKKEALTGSEFCYENIDCQIKMTGVHQVINAVTAVEAVKALRKKGFEISENDLRCALTETSVASRTEIISREPVIIIDGGHNRAGVDSLAEVMRLRGSVPAVGVVGMVKGKDIEYAAKRFSEIFSYVYCVDGFEDNAVSAGELAKLFDCPCESADFLSGIKMARERAERESAWLTVCGSLYLASAAGKLFAEKPFL